MSKTVGIRTIGIQKTISVYFIGNVSVVNMGYPCYGKAYIIVYLIKRNYNLQIEIIRKCGGSVKAVFIQLSNKFGLVKGIVIPAEQVYLYAIGKITFGEENPYLVSLLRFKIGGKNQQIVSNTR